MEEKILTILNDISVPFAILGRNYLVEAVIYVLEKGRPYVTKEIYPHVAKRFNTTPARAERAIRHAIESAFSNAETNTIIKYFGTSRWQKEGKLTNSEFIFGLAEYLKLHK